MILKINDRIRHRQIEFFTKTQLSLHYDSLFSKFVFSFYFDPDIIEHKEMACVGHYHICTIEENGELLLTGILMSEAFNRPKDRQLVTLGGHSLPGVLSDCEVPPGDSLQSNGLNLKQIAEKYLKPFGLGMVITPAAAAAMEEPYEEVIGKESQTVKTLLNDLTSQKNIVLTHDEYGRVVFTKAPVNPVPIFHFTKATAASMSLSFDGNVMHSDIYVIKQDDTREDSLQTIDPPLKNPYVPYVFRPRVVVQSSTNKNDSGQTARNILAQELRGLRLTIVCDRWVLNDKIIRPGKEITVLNPEVYLYKSTRFLIESVDLESDENKKVAKLQCVLPECYNGQAPGYIFQGINLH